jgi:hypothetical protein
MDASSDKAGGTASLPKKPCAKILLTYAAADFGFEQVARVTLSAVLFG